MKSKLIIYFALFSALLTLPACEVVVPLELPEHTPVLVVNGTFQPDSAFAVKVLHSVPVTDTGGVRLVTGATVHILEGGAVIDTLTYTTDGNYRSVSNVRPAVGREYTVRASAPGFETVEGSDVVPDSVSVYGLAYRDSVVGGLNGEEPEGEITFRIDDPAGEDNFYFLQVYSAHIDTISSPGDTLYYLFDSYIRGFDPAMQATYVRGGLIFDDALFDGRSQELYVRIPSIDYQGGPVLLGLASISRDYHDHALTFEAYQNSAFSPFSEPVFIHSNISSGMGIFAGFSLVWREVP